MATGKFGVGVIGCGTVGGGVVKLLVEEAENLRRKTGVAVELCKAADIDPASASHRSGSRAAHRKRARNPGRPCDPRGGRGHRRRQGGLLPCGGGADRGKHVVTANKELIARKGLSCSRWRENTT